LSPDAPTIADLSLGRIPLIVSLPHVGTQLPADIARTMTPVAAELVDTDWHVERLYDFAKQSGASWLQARVSRYAIDVNRPPDNQSLYPGQTTTELCPTATFAGQPLYTAGNPTEEEIGRRRERYWKPYHAMLRELVEVTRARFGYAVLLDAHSIRSELPRLFTGRLPHINVGTNDGRSCAPALSEQVMTVLSAQDRFTHVLNGRFKGGYITRTFGNPAEHVHAMQIELAQCAYMNESGSDYDPSIAQPLRSLLHKLVAEMVRFDPATQWSH
jgi:N-formylglutamate deformylase